ncbi:MAG: hypothetical protein US69_C0010G0013 [candidate division TM6 bacterium GW2011_GWF2_38_10]|nr:MAG: hypothetical protein US69_C0010G0013 [candidate division TM6 bacterium GW2011_GWF2_38_10]
MFQDKKGWKSIVWLPWIKVSIKHLKKIEKVIRFTKQKKNN